MAFDPIRKRTVLFGGSTTFTMDDTWEWDGNLWLAADAGTPGRRDALGLAWNHTAGSMVLFGGYRGGAGTFADTWSRSGGVAWTAEAPLASPPPRSSLAMAWDPVGRRVVMTGGWLPYQELKQDTWTFDGTTWRQDVDAPYPWFRQALASHPSLGVVAWGGDSDSGPRSDTLYLSPVGWLPVPLTPAEGPCFLDASGTVAGRVMDGSAWTLGRFEWERTHDFPAADITHVVRTPEGLLALSPTASWFDPLDGGWVEAVDGGAHPEPRFLLWDDVLAQLWLVTPAGELYTLNAGGWDLRSVLGPGVRAVAGAPDGGLFILQNEVEHYDPFTATRTPFSPAPPGDAGLTLFFDRRRDLLVSAAPTSATPVAEWDGVAWVQIETAHLPIEFIGARPGGTLVARGGDGDAVIDYEQLRALGSRCAEDRQCAGGFCADGRCCESACSGGMGDCRACSFESGSTEDGHCTTIRPGFVAVCASQPPCLQAVCVPGDPVCPPLSDLSCPLDAGPVQQRDAGRPRSDAGSDQPATAPPCGCASVRGAGLLLLLSLFTRRRGSSPALSPR